MIIDKKIRSNLEDEIFLEEEEDSYILKEADVRSLLKYFKELTSVSLGLTLTL
jgi:hypothetical protein